MGTTAPALSHTWASLDAASRSRSIGARRNLLVACMILLPLRVPRITTGHLHLVYPRSYILRLQGGWWRLPIFSTGASLPRNGTARHSQTHYFSVSY